MLSSNTVTFLFYVYLGGISIGLVLIIILIIIWLFNSLHRK